MLLISSENVLLTNSALFLLCVITLVYIYKNSIIKTATGYELNCNKYKLTIYLFSILYIGLILLLSIIASRFGFFSILKGKHDKLKPIYKLLTVGLLFGLIIGLIVMISVIDIKKHFLMAQSLLFLIALAFVITFGSSLFTQNITAIKFFIIFITALIIFIIVSVIGHYYGEIFVKEHANKYLFGFIGLMVVVNILLNIFVKNQKLLRRLLFGKSVLSVIIICLLTVFINRKIVDDEPACENPYVSIVSLIIAFTNLIVEGSKLM